MKRKKSDQDKASGSKRPLARRRDGQVDGRSLRRTGRHVLFAARVTEDFPKAVKEIAARENRTIGEVLEEAIRRYPPAKKPKAPSAG